MSVTWNIVNIPLGEGIDTKTDSKALPPTKLEVLENGVFTDKISIKKRNGYADLSVDIIGNGNIASARALSTRDSELVLFNNTSAYGYSAGASKWSERGDLYSIGVIQGTEASTPAEQTVADFSTTGSISSFAWEDQRGGIYVSVEDTVSKTVILSDYQITATGSNPRCVAFNGHVHVLYTDAGVLKNIRISSTDPLGTASATPITLVSDMDSSTPYYDVKNYSTYGVVAYLSSGGDLKVFYIAVDGTLGSPGNGGHPVVTTYAGLSPDKGVCIAVHPTDGSMFIAYADTVVGDAAVIGIDILFNRLGGAAENPFSTTAGETASITNITGAFEKVARTSGIYYCQFFYEMSASETYNHIVRSEEAYYDVSEDPEVQVGAVRYNWRHSGIASHAFGDADGVFVNLVHDSSQQATYMTAKHTGTFVCKLLPGIAGGLSTAYSLPSVHTDGNKHTWVGTYKNRLPVNVGTNETYSERGIKSFELDFDSGQSHRSVQLGNTTYITGGYLHQYDGGNPVESGFHLYPENITTSSATTSSGSLTTTGNYNYRCFWEWYTESGEREISATASGVNVSLAGSDNTITLNVPTLSWTSKKEERSDVRLAITRTENGGTTRYRVDNPLSPVWNNINADTVSFTDTISDAVLTTRELDYTNAEYDHIAPPSAEIITNTKDRIFLAGFEDPNLIRYSKLRRWGKGVAFHDGLQILLDQSGGSITALGSIDDKVIVFKEHRIFAFAGDGPDDVGLDGDTFQSPQLVTSNVGCTNQRSIVLMPEGLMFQSSKGIYYIDRSLQLVYIGADVEAFNSQTIKAATLLADKNLVIFVPESGSALVYDYYFKQWSTFTDHAGVDAVIWNNNYTYARSTGVVLQETANFFKDVNSPIKLAMETGWLSFDNVQGYAKVRRAYLLGDYKSAHTLQIKIAYNYENYFSDTVTWDPTTVIETGIYGLDTAIGDVGTYGTGTGAYGGSGNTVYQVKIQMPRQKVQSVKFRFEDITGDDPGESFELNALTLEVGTKSTPFKLPSTKIT